MTAVKAAKTLPLQDGFFSAHLGATDPELADAIRGELRRQQDQIELIASENVVSLAVLEAQGSVLTNKYAEGYPHRRYYGACEYVDILEELALPSAKYLFDCAFWNVQPPSGPQPTLARRIPSWPTRSAASCAASRTRSSSSPRRTWSPWRCSRRRARCSPTNMPRATRTGATTAAASMSTSSKSSPSRVPKSCSTARS